MKNRRPKLKQTDVFTEHNGNFLGVLYTYDRVKELAEIYGFEIVDMYSYVHGGRCYYSKYDYSYDEDFKCGVAISKDRMRFDLTCKEKLAKWLNEHSRPQHHAFKHPYPTIGVPLIETDLIKKPELFKNINYLNIAKPCINTFTFYKDGNRYGGIEYYGLPNEFSKPVFEYLLAVLPKLHFEGRLDYDGDVKL